MFNEEEMANFNLARKKSEWEESLKVSTHQKSCTNDSVGFESLGKIKEMFEKGQISNEELKKMIDQRSVSSEANNRSTIQEELEDLRQSSKIQKMFRLESGKDNKACSLRRTNSCIGVSGERLPEDLDDEVMAEVSMTNKMVKAMFEQNAPKYKFGGSGSNLSINNSSENVSKQGPVKRPSVKPKEERKWVLDTINKYFDVIVEEEEDEEEDMDEDGDDSSSEEDYDVSSEYSDDFEEDNGDVEDDLSNNYQSSKQLRGMLSSVVSRISGSVGNLAQKDIMQSLKQNLGSQINLKQSNSNLTAN